MSVTKSPNQWGVMVETEASYGAAPTMVLADDGVLVMEAPEVDHSWVNDGDRGPTLRRSGKSGLSGSVDLVTELLVASAPFSASIVPPFLHDLMQASGHIATVDVAGGNEKWTYTPDADVTNWTSVGAEVYIDGEKNILTGVFGDLSIASENGEVPSWSFPLTGILAIDADASVPAIVYDQVSTQPPKAVGMTVNIGDYVAAVVRSFTFNKNNGDPTARTDEQIADLHKGFVGELGTPTLELVIERTALQATPFHKVAGLNPRELEKAATAIVVDLSWGATQYGTAKINVPLAELVEVDEGREGNISIWTLTFACQRATPTGADSYSIVIT